MYVPLPVNTFQKSILLIVQYKYLKSCSEDLTLLNLILRTRSCNTGFIAPSSWVFHFHPTIMVGRKCFVPLLYQFRRGVSGGAALISCYMIHRGGRICQDEHMWTWRYDKMMMTCQHHEMSTWRCLDISWHMLTHNDVSTWWDVVTYVHLDRVSTRVSCQHDEMWTWRCVCWHICWQYVDRCQHDDVSAWTCLIVTLSCVEFGNTLYRHEHILPWHSRWHPISSESTYLHTLYALDHLLLTLSYRHVDTLLPCGQDS